MNDLKLEHAKMTIIVKKDIMTGDKPFAVEMTGCFSCLQDAFTDCLLNNPTFKDFVNKSVRAANEIRAKSQN